MSRNPGGLCSFLVSIKEIDVCLKDRDKHLDEKESLNILIRRI